MTAPAVLVIIGAGPRGTGVLERISANLSELFGDRELTVHLVDPFPPGAGRVWRYDQSPLLRMNSMAEDVTMFTDSSVRCDGPIRPGPSLSEWAQQARVDGVDDPTVTAELRAMRGGTFATRRLQSYYLAWVFEQTVNGLPDSVSVRVHAAKATGVTDGDDGRQHVWLADCAEPLTADTVILALGHLDADPGQEHQDLRMFARANDLRYLPPEYSADSDLTAVRPGEDVLMRGFGLAFIDLMALLTEGRGGVFLPGSDGTLTYRPSGREPRLHVGSRRGVPYHAKTTYRLLAPRPEFPQFFGPDAIVELAAHQQELDFRADLWPLMAKEIAWGYYHELFNGHPGRVLMDWENFADRYTRLHWNSPQLHLLIAEAVPATVDRLDFEALDRPLRGLSFDSAEAFQAHLRGYVAADIARRCDQGHSADLGAFYALLSVYGQVPNLLATGRLAARSQVLDVDGWWSGFFSYFASGPPDDRLRQLLALSDAGVVDFVGADMWVRADDVRGVFLAGSSSTPDVVAATALIEARLPKASVRHSRDQLLRTLDGVEEQLVGGTFRQSTGLLRTAQGDGRVLDAEGRPHPRRFALGAHTNARAVAAFSRPMTNSPAFRQNDATARAVLSTLVAQVCLATSRVA